MVIEKEREVSGGGGQGKEEIQGRKGKRKEKMPRA